MENCRDRKSAALMVCNMLDEFQRSYAEQAREPNGMPGNEYYSRILMNIVGDARAAITIEEPCAGVYGEQELREELSWLRRVYRSWLDGLVRLSSTGAMAAECEIDDSPAAMELKARIGARSESRPVDRPITRTCAKCRQEFALRPEAPSWLGICKECLNGR